MNNANNTRTFTVTLSAPLVATFEVEASCVSSLQDAVAAAISGWAFDHLRGEDVRVLFTATIDGQAFEEGRTILVIVTRPVFGPTAARKPSARERSLAKDRADFARECATDARKAAESDARGRARVAALAMSYVP